VAVLSRVGDRSDLAEITNNAVHVALEGRGRLTSPLQMPRVNAHPIGGLQLLPRGARLHYCACHLLGARAARVGHPLFLEIYSAKACM
jgi:hypothetical protein